MINIEKVTRSSELYPELRRLWHEVFEDPEEFVDAFYDNWGEEVHGYVLSDEAGVQAALTCFRMGELKEAAGCNQKAAGKMAAGCEVWISYAICTRPEARGKGYGAAITEFARDEVIAGGAISMLSPAEASLVDFYEPLGYAANGRAGSVDWDSFDSAKWRLIKSGRYYELREEYLTGSTHIVPSEATRAWVDSEYGEYLESTDGRAICIREAELLPLSAVGQDYVQGMTAGYTGNVYLGFAFD